MEKEEFYNLCSEALNSMTAFKNIEYRKSGTNRWGPRQPGNGRYPGVGIVRFFNENMIHVSVADPLTSKTFTSVNEALDFLRTI